MSFIKRLEFGNYTLKFGKDLVLLDFLEEVVKPAFETKSIRLHGETHYFFLDTNLMILDKEKDGTPVIGISGKLIKNTKLKSNQKFDSENRTLVEETEEISTAPSSTFLLILNNHRLIYSRDVPNAPQMSTFQTTSRYFLRKKYGDFRKDLYDIVRNYLDTPIFNKTENYQYGNVKKKHITNVINELRLITDQGNSVTKKDINEAITKLYPEPDLRVTPLSSDSSIEDFVKRFKKIDKVEISVLDTNNENLNNSSFFKSINRHSQNNDSKNTKISYQNNEGLNKPNILDEIQDANSLGNTGISISGLDCDDQKLRGSNEEIKLQVDAPQVPANDVRFFSKAMYSKFSSLVDKGTIVLPVIVESKFGELLYKIAKNLNE